MNVFLDTEALIYIYISFWLGIFNCWYTGLYCSWRVMAWNVIGKGNWPIKILAHAEMIFLSGKTKLSWSYNILKLFKYVAFRVGGTWKPLYSFKFWSLLCEKSKLYNVIVSWNPQSRLPLGGRYLKTLRFFKFWCFLQAVLKFRKKAPHSW